MSPALPVHDGFGKDPRPDPRHARCSKLARLLPSLLDFVFLTPVFLIFGRMNGARVLLGDGDTGWHIRTGEWILAHRQIPTHDIFSYTRPDQPWYAWEWLSDVLMALVHKAGGLQAVVLGSILLICLTFTLLYRLVLRRCRNPAIAYCVTAVAAAGSAIHWLARPHLFTLLFVVIFYAALETRHPRKLFYLPLVMVIWTNLHGGFFIGIVLVGAYAAGEWTAALLSEGPRRTAAFAQGNLYAALAAACFVATFVNPYTWHLHRHLLEYLTHPAYFEGIQEFLPISFQHPLARFYEPMLFLAPAAAFWHLWRRQYSVFILIALWMHLSLLAVRNVPVFLLIAAPPVGAALAEGFRHVPGHAAAKWLRNLAEAAGRTSAMLTRTGLQPRWHLVCVLAFLLLAVRMYTPAAGPQFQAEYDPAVYPKQALLDLRSTDRVFTDDEWGDYLIYHSHPARKVFIDGRSDFYGPEFEKQYLDILHTRGQWRKTLDSFHVDTILARAETPLCSALTESPGWKQVHNDGVAVIFHRVPSL